MVNANTGDKPKSWIKITLLIVIIIAILIVLALVFSNK